MVRSSALIYVVVGALIAEAIMWGVLLPWAHYRYATGVSFGVGLWKPVVLVAFVGAALGFVTFVIRQAVSGR